MRGFFSVECRLFVFMLRSFLNVYCVPIQVKCACVRACKVSIQCVVLLLSYALVCDRCLKRNCRHTILYGIFLSVLCCMCVLVLVVGTLRLFCWRARFSIVWCHFEYFCANTALHSSLHVYLSVCYFVNLIRFCGRFYHF